MLSEQHIKRIETVLQQHITMATLLADIVQDAIRDDVGIRAVTIDRDLVVRAIELLRSLNPAPRK